MLGYLNKKKGQDAKMDAGIPVSRPAESDGFKRLEEKKEAPTLFQMMNSANKQQPLGDVAQKSIKERRIEFELNQTNADRNRTGTKGL